MPTTYYSTRCTTPAKPARGGDNGALSVVGTFAVNDAANMLVAGNVIQMVTVPKGAVILDVILNSTDLDTNASPTITMSVGDGDAANRFINASNVAQAGGVARASQAANSIGYTYTAEDTIDITIAANAATAANGTINLVVLYAMQA